MLPKKSFSVTPTIILPPILKCSRGYRTSLDVSQTLKILAYPAASSVILRPLPDLFPCEVLSGHRSPVSAVRFSPSSKFLASGDESGKVIVWDCASKKEFKSFEPSTNAIVDLCWANDQILIIAVPGKDKFLIALHIETAKPLGQMHYHTQKVGCCDCTHSEPFYCVAGSEDRNIGVFKGTPFDLHKYFQEHSNYVNDIRYSPNGSMFASGSGDRKVLLFDTKAMAKIKDLSEAKNAHTGTIISLNWVDDERLLTGSLDKTCKLWDTKAAAVLGTMAVKAEKLEIEDMQAGCASFAGETLISVTLNGKVNVWNVSELKADGVNLPKKVVEGHKGRITALCYNQKKGALVSGDSEGIACVWNGNFPKSAKLHNGNLSDIKEAADGQVYIAGTYNMLFKIDSEANTSLSLKLESSPIQIAPSKTDPATVYVLLSNGSLLKVVGDAVKEKYKASDGSTALEINETDNEIYVGDKKGLIHIYSMKDFKELASVTEYTNEITCLSYHHETKRLAATDRLKLLYLYDIGAREIIGNPMSGHSGAVWNCKWSPSGEFLATASLDFAVTVWNSTTKPCQKISIERIHSGGSTCVAFKDETTLYTGGNDGLINEIKIEKVQAE